MLPESTGFTLSYMFQLGKCMDLLKILTIKALLSVSHYARSYLKGLRGLPSDLPGGTVVKNQPANAGHTGSISGPGRSHMPWSN